jgi:hypothetical protein
MGRAWLRRVECISKLTQLRPLKHLQLRVRVQKALDGLDVLLILEPSKDIQVIQSLGQVSVEDIPGKHSISLIGSIVLLLRLLVFVAAASLILQHLVDNESCF